MIAFALVSVLIAAGCGSGNSADPTSSATAPATATRTQSGEVLKIDGNVVERIYESGVNNSTVYAETAESLYVRESSDWAITTTRPNGRQIIVHPINAELLYRGGHPSCNTESDNGDFSFSISDDGGHSWRVTESGAGIQPIVIDASLPEVIFGSDCGLWISSDLGESWAEFEPGMFEAVAAGVVNGQQLLVLDLAVDGDGTIYAIDIAAPSHPALIGEMLNAPNLTSLDANQTQLVAGGIQGVFVSTDGGATWTNSRNGLEDVTVEDVGSISPRSSVGDDLPFGVLAVRLDPTHEGRIFAGTAAGLYISQDNGITWDIYTEIAPDTRVTDILITGGGNELFVTTSEGVVVVPNP